MAPKIDQPLKRPRPADLVPQIAIEEAETAAEPTASATFKPPHSSCQSSRHVPNHVPNHTTAPAPHVPNNGSQILHHSSEDIMKQIVFIAEIQGASNALCKPETVYRFATTLNSLATQLQAALVREGKVCHEPPEQVHVHVQHDKEAVINDKVAQMCERSPLTIPVIILKGTSGDCHASTITYPPATMKQWMSVLSSQLFAFDDRLRTVLATHFVNKKFGPLLTAQAECTPSELLPQEIHRKQWSTAQNMFHRWRTQVTDMLFVWVCKVYVYVCCRS